MAKVEKPATDPAPKDRTDEVLGAINGLTAAVTELVKIKKEEPASSAPVTQPEVKTETSAYKYPVPLEFKEVVAQVLNQHFSVEIIAQGGTFQLDILVPKKYSNAHQNHWDTFKEDRRSRIIPSSEGVNGVRLWAEKVWNNLTPEAKSAVVFDRAQPNI